jgi:putative acetyltransferase
MPIRGTTLADMPTLAVLHRLTVKTSLPYLPDLHTAEEDLAFFSATLFPANDIWAAEMDGAILGYAAASPGWLNHLYVHPHHQGAGVGAALLAQVMSGADDLQLWAFQKNTRARGFYERRGFELVRLTDGTGNEEREPDALYRWVRG